MRELPCRLALAPSFASDVKHQTRDVRCATAMASVWRSIGLPVAGNKSEVSLRD